MHLDTPYGQTVPFQVDRKRGHVTRSRPLISYTSGDYAVLNKAPAGQETCSATKRHRDVRRNTVAIGRDVLESVERFREVEEKSLPVEQVTGVADEYLYDFAPFYRRRQKTSLLKNFMSLRRKSKKPDVGFDVHEDSQPLYENFQPLRQGNGIKQFFTRTLSLR